jgi:hypothetical protein
LAQGAGAFLTHDRFYVMKDYWKKFQWAGFEDVRPMCAENRANNSGLLFLFLFFFFFVLAAPCGQGA